MRSLVDERIMRCASGELFWCRVTGHWLDSSDPQALCIWTFSDLSEKRIVYVDLSPRERELAAFLVEGMTSKVIREKLGLSTRTVEYYRRGLMKKLKVQTYTEMISRLLSSRA